MGHVKKEEPVSQETARRVLQIESEAVAALAERIDESFDRAVDLLVGCSGRIFLTGMGKSGFIAQKLAATLSSTGSPSHFIHPAEAIHGDLGMLVAGDMLVAISNSGETEAKGDGSEHPGREHPTVASAAQSSVEAQQGECAEDQVAIAEQQLHQM